MRKIFARILILSLLMLGACRKDPKLTDSTYIFRASQNLTITLNFDDNGQYFGRAFNRYFGTYQTAGDHMMLGPVSSTMMSGSEDKMATEEDYLNRLSQTHSYRLTPDNLILISDDGHQMIFDIRKTQEENIS